MLLISRSPSSAPPTPSPVRSSSCSASPRRSCGRTSKGTPRHDRAGVPDRGMMESIEPTRLIEVFADVVCPFTHVGLRRLVGYRERAQREDVAIRVRAWPLELVNGEEVPRE